MIALIVVINSAVGVVQEVRADRAITALTQMSAPYSRVRRDGAVVSVPSSVVVPGESIPVGHVGKEPDRAGHQVSAGTVSVGSLDLADLAPGRRHVTTPAMTEAV